MINLTIDGQAVTVPEDSTILDAASQLGIRIPTLCHHPALEPYGACRVCTIEVRYSGRTRMVTACNYPAWEGIEVLTASEKVLKHRRMIVEFELGRCSTVPVLRQLADELGIDKSRFGDEKAECILCGLCVRMCWEIVGAKAIAFANRGVDREVTAPYGEAPGACIGCGACAEVCPTGVIKLEDMGGRKVLHHELSLGPPKPIRVPLLQAVPNVPFIDTESCIHFQTGGCKVCAALCPKEAINHEMPEEEEEIEVGAILAATGYEVLDVSPLLQYGYGTYDNVITGLEFELLCHASGPTGGKILKADGMPPESVAILHCIGSRDENHQVYCSRVCCMYSMKFAHLVREKTGAEVYEFYIDIRAAGKGYEEFYKRMLKEDVRFVRGKAAEVIDWAQTPAEEGKLIVQAEDTLLGRARRIPVDMVILSPALQAQADAKAVAHMLGIGCGTEGWFMERHPKLAPVQTAADGVYVAGACQFPKDIPDCVAQGAAAAANILSLVDRGVFSIEPVTAEIDEQLCGGCKTCILMCPYTAITFDQEKKIAVVEDALCKGCGTCVAACPAGAAQQLGYTDAQISAELEGALARAM
jgi:heterodisulfide reductase subunit A